MTIEFKYAIGDKVTIKALDLPGTVMAACYRGEITDSDNQPLSSIIDYRVVYWADSKRFDEWLYEFELE